MTDDTTLIFDNSIRARETVRKVAQSLVQKKGYSPNKQATLINAFLDNKGSEYRPLAEIKPTTWIDFVLGRTTSPGDPRLIHAAWLWMRVDCPDLLRDVFEEAGKPDVFWSEFEQHIGALKGTLTGLSRRIPRDVDVIENLKGMFSFSYPSRFSDDEIRGSFQLHTGGNGVFFTGDVTIEIESNRTKAVGLRGSIVPHKIGHTLLSSFVDEEPEGDGSLFLLEVGTHFEGHFARGNQQGLLMIRTTRFGKILSFDTNCTVTPLSETCASSERDC